jgi:hypothetical protein
VKELSFDEGRRLATLIVIQEKKIFWAQQKLVA